MKSNKLSFISFLTIVSLGIPYLSFGNNYLNSDYSDDFKSISITMLDDEAPPPVQNLEAKSAPGGTIVITWNHPGRSAVSDLKGFYVYREKHLEEIKLLDSLIVTSDTTNFSYTDTPLKSLQEGRLYSYKVFAFDNDNNISASTLTTPEISDSTVPTDPKFIWDEESYDFTDTLDVESADSVIYYKRDVYNIVKVVNPNHNKMDPVDFVHYIRFQWVRNDSSLFLLPVTESCSQNRCITEWMPIDLMGNTIQDSLYFDLDGSVPIDTIDGSLYLYAAQFKDESDNMSSWARMATIGILVEAIQDVFPPEKVRVVKNAVETYDSNNKGQVNLQWEAKEDPVSGTAKFIVRRELYGEIKLKDLPPDSMRYPDPIQNDLNHQGRAGIAEYCISVLDNVGNISDTVCVTARHKVGPKISYIASNLFYNNRLNFQIDYESEIPVQDFLVYENENIISSCELASTIDSCGNVLPENTCSVPFDKGKHGDNFYIYTTARYFDGDESLNSNTKRVQRDTIPPVSVTDLTVTNKKPAWANSTFKEWDGNLYLEWTRPEKDPTKDIVCYDVYRINEKDTLKVGSVVTSEDTTRFVDLANNSSDSLVTYKFYTYYVKARDKAGSLSAPSNFDSSYCNRAPIITKANLDSSAIEIFWTRPTPRLPSPFFDTCVKVYKDTITTDSLVTDTTVSNITYYTFSSPEAEHNYFFLVQEKPKEKDIDSLITAWSKPFNHSFLASPNDLTVTNQKPTWADSSFKPWDGNLYLQWTKPDDDIIGYEIYRNDSLVKTLTTNEDTIRFIDLANPMVNLPGFKNIIENDDSLVTYQFYTYYVKAFDDKDTSGVSNSDEDYCNRAPIIKRAKLGSDDIEICWTRPTPRKLTPIFKTNVRVYRNSVEDDSLEVETTTDTNKTCFSFPDPASEVTYFFLVQENPLEINDDSLKTAWSKPFEQKFQAPPNGLTVTDQQPAWAENDFQKWDGNLYLEWTRPGDAIGYIVYRDGDSLTTVKSAQSVVRYVDIANPTANPPILQHIINNEESLVTYQFYSYTVKAFDDADTSGVSGSDGDYCNRAPIITNSNLDSSAIEICWTRPTPRLNSPDFETNVKVYKGTNTPANLVADTTIKDTCYSFLNPESEQTYIFIVQENPLGENLDMLITEWSKSFIHSLFMEVRNPISSQMPIKSSYVDFPQIRISSFPDNLHSIRIENVTQNRIVQSETNLDDLPRCSVDSDTVCVNDSLATSLLDNEYKVILLDLFANEFGTGTMTGFGVKAPVFKIVTYDPITELLSFELRYPILLFHLESIYQIHLFTQFFNPKTVDITQKTFLYERLGPKLIGSKMDNIDSTDNEVIINGNIENVIPIDAFKYYAYATIHLENNSRHTRGDVDSVEAFLVKTLKNPRLKLIDQPEFGRIWIDWDFAPNDAGMEPDTFKISRDILQEFDPILYSDGPFMDEFESDEQKVLVYTVIPGIKLSPNNSRRVYWSENDAGQQLVTDSFRGFVPFASFPDDDSTGYVPFSESTGFDSVFINTDTLKIVWDWENITLSELVGLIHFQVARTQSFDNPINIKITNPDSIQNVKFVEVPDINKSAKLDFPTHGDSIFVRLSAKDIEFNNSNIVWFDTLLAVIDAQSPSRPDTLQTTLSCGWTSDTSKVNLNLTWERPTDFLSGLYDSLRIEIRNIFDNDISISLHINKPKSPDVPDLSIADTSFVVWTPSETNLDTLQLINIDIDKLINTNDTQFIIVTYFDKLLNQRLFSFDSFPKAVDHRFKLRLDKIKGNDGNVTTFHLKWQPILDHNIDKYVINYSPNKSFLGLPPPFSIFVDVNKDSTSWSLPASTTNLYFHVCALFKNGASSNWSNVTSTNSNNSDFIFPILTDVDNENEIPRSYALYQNYPNPFNPSTTIRYDLPINDHVRLMIYDIFGRVIRILVNDEQNQGKYSIVWDGKNSNDMIVPTGIYFIVLESGTFRFVKKGLIVK